MTKTLANEVWRSFHINMPVEFIPIYKILQSDFNYVLSNETIRNNLLNIDLYDKKGRKKINGDLWKEMRPILKKVTINGKNMVDSWPISQKGWYLRIFMDNLIRLIRSLDEKIIIYNTLLITNMEIDKNFFDLLSKANIFTTIGNIENIKSSERIPELPRKATFQLDFSSTDNQTCYKISDNYFFINYLEKKYLDYIVELPMSLRKNLTGEIARPKFLCRAKDGKYVGVCSYKVFKQKLFEDNGNVLGVDIGRIKPYSASVVSKNGEISDEYVPTEYLKNIFKKIDVLYNEIRLLSSKYKRISNLNKNNKEYYYQITKDRQKRRKEQINFLFNKITNLKSEAMTLMANEITDIAIKEECSTINIENLSWLKSTGGKWNFSYFQKRLTEISELYNIKVVKVNAKNTSREHPVTKELGKKKGRLIHFSDSDIIDRDRLASINIAIRSNNKRKSIKLKKINLNYKTKSIEKESKRKDIKNSSKDFLENIKMENKIVVYPPGETCKSNWLLSCKIFNKYFSFIPKAKNCVYNRRTTHFYT